MHLTHEIRTQQKYLTGWSFWVKYDDWLVVEPYTSEKYEFVNWDDDIPVPTEWKNHQVMFQENRQPDQCLVHQPSIYHLSNQDDLQRTPLPFPHRKSAARHCEWPLENRIQQI